MSALLQAEFSLSENTNDCNTSCRRAIGNSNCSPLASETNLPKDISKKGEKQNPFTDSSLTAEGSSLSSAVKVPGSSPEVDTLGRNEKHKFKTKEGRSHATGDSCYYERGKVGTVRKKFQIDNDSSIRSQ